MEISARQFKQIVDDCRRQQQGGGRLGDRRQSARVGGRYAVKVRAIIPYINRPQTPFVAWLRDVSAGGVCLTCPAAIGGEFLLELPGEHTAGGPAARDVAGGGDADVESDAGQPVEVVRCRVTYCRKVGRDQCVVGAAFLDG